MSEESLESLSTSLLDVFVHPGKYFEGDEEAQQHQEMHALMESIAELDGDSLSEVACGFICSATKEGYSESDVFAFWSLMELPVPPTPARRAKKRKGHKGGPKR